MKRITIISLIIVFLTCQSSYAARPSGNIMPTKEETQELTQEEIEGIFIALLSSIDSVLVDRESIDWEEFIEIVEETQDIEPLLNQGACILCLISIIIVDFLASNIGIGCPVAFLILFVSLAITIPIMLASCNLCIE